MVHLRIRYWQLADFWYYAKRYWCVLSLLFPLCIELYELFTRFDMAHNYTVDIETCSSLAIPPVHCFLHFSLHAICTFLGEFEGAHFQTLEQDGRMKRHDFVQGDLVLLPLVSARCPISNDRHSGEHVPGAVPQSLHMIAMLQTYDCPVSNICLS